MATTIGAAATLVPAQSRAGISSLSLEWAATTVPTATVLSATAAVDSATDGVDTTSETSKESSLSHSCHCRRWGCLPLHRLHCVCSFVAQATATNNGERAGGHTAGNGEYHAYDPRICSDSNVKAYAYAIADVSANSEANTDSSDCGPTYGETDANIDASTNADSQAVYRRLWQSMGVQLR